MRGESRSIMHGQGTQKDRIHRKHMQNSQSLEAGEGRRRFEERLWNIELVEIPDVETKGDKKRARLLINELNSLQALAKAEGKSDQIENFKNRLRKVCRIAQKSNSPEKTEDTSDEEI